MQGSTSVLPIVTVLSLHKGVNYITHSNSVDLTQGSTTILPIVTVLSLHKGLQLYYPL